jgi:hypothetical protein
MSAHVHTATRSCHSILQPLSAGVSKRRLVRCRTGSGSGSPGPSSEDAELRLAIRRPVPRRAVRRRTRGWRSRRRRPHRRVVLARRLGALSPLPASTSIPTIRRCWASCSGVEGATSPASTRRFASAAAATNALQPPQDLMTSRWVCSYPGHGAGSLTPSQPDVLCSLSSSGRIVHLLDSRGPHNLSHGHRPIATGLIYPARAHGPGRTCESAPVGTGAEMQGPSSQHLRTASRRAHIQMIPV